MNTAQRLALGLVRVEVEVYPNKRMYIKMILPGWKGPGEDFHCGFFIADRDFNEEWILSTAREAFVKSIIDNEVCLQRGRELTYRLGKMLRRIASPIELQDPEIAGLLQEVGE